MIVLMNLGMIADYKENENKVIIIFTSSLYIVWDKKDKKNIHNDLMCEKSNVFVDW